MKRIGIVYWSGTGNTKRMAELIAEGALTTGAEVDVYECSQFSEKLVSEYDVLAFGCPCMGAEQLEDGEFEPMFDGIKQSLAAKDVALFGSFGWGDGEWMRNWEEDCEAIGANLIQPSYIVNELPTGESENQCKEFGRLLDKMQ